MALSNSQYNGIMRLYSQRQLTARHEREKRAAKIYGEIPQLAELDDAIRSQAVMTARKLLDGDEEAKKTFRRQLEDLREQKEALLLAYGYKPEDLEMQYHCPYCQDTGYVDGKKCRCFRKEEIRLLYAQSNLQEILERENFSTFSYAYYDDRQVIPQLGMTVAAYMRTVYGWCREFVENFSEKGGNLLFTGETGVGKTFLTNCIAKELLDRYYSVIYLSATDLFDIFSKNQSYREPEDEVREIYPYLLDSDLLIIDDLGTELNNAFVSSRLFYCVNERLLRKKSTIISTNMTTGMLRDTYSERISSRIISHYTTIPLYGGDMRTKIGRSLD